MNILHFICRYDFLANICHHDNRNQYHVAIFRKINKQSGEGADMFGG